MSTRFACYCLILALLCVRVFADEGSDNQKVQDLYRKHLAPLASASQSELQQILDAPAKPSHVLAVILKNPEYEFTVGWLRGITETEILDLRPSAQGGLLSLDVRIECLRRHAAVSLLAKRGKFSLLDWFATKRVDSEATLFDAVLMDFLKPHRGNPITKQKRDKWMQPTKGKNPICRIIAFRFVNQWAEKSQIAGIVESALRDKFWYARSTALRSVRLVNPEVAKAMLKEYLVTAGRVSVPKAFGPKEERLKQQAKNILSEIADYASKNN